MAEMMVSLSDFLIALLALIFSWKLWALSANQKQLRNNFLGLFMAVAVGAILGGIYHGFLSGGENRLAAGFAAVVWGLTLISVGVSAYNLWLIDIQLVVSERMFKWGRHVVRGLLLVYLLVVIFGSRDFRVAIIAYVPPALVLFFILVLRIARQRNRFHFVGIGGLILTFLAAYVQQAKISISSDYLNYNVVYHLLQALGLWGLYFLGSRMSRFNI